jgi:gluconate 2-dehydrogenase gamma chain
MTEPSQTIGLSRRALLERAVLLVGGAAALSQLGACSASDAPFFSSRQMARLDAITDIIIPATDTPGARGAGVPAFIDGMMTNWASRETRAKFVRVLDGVEARGRQQFQGSFLELTPEQQTETVRLYDAEQIAAEDAPYRAFKQLVLLGYYHSEIGATQELRYELVPGHWLADVPFSQIGRAWA